MGLLFPPSPLSSHSHSLVLYLVVVVDERHRNPRLERARGLATCHCISVPSLPFHIQNSATFPRRLEHATVKTETEISEYARPVILTEGGISVQRLTELINFLLQSLYKYASFSSLFNGNLKVLAAVCFTVGLFLIARG